MDAWKRWTGVAAVSGALLIGGAAMTLAQDAGPELDVDQLAEQLELDQEGRAELGQLQELLNRRAAMHQQMAEVRSEMGEVMQSLRGQLSPEQHRELFQAMHQSGAMPGPGAGMGARGSGMGHPGGMMMQMKRGSHMHGQGGMMGRGMMGPGMMHGQGMGPMHPNCPWAPGSEDSGNDTP